MVSQTPQVWIDCQLFERSGELVLVWDTADELFPEHMTDDLNMLETADKSIYDSVLVKSKQIKDKVIYNALNSMYTEYCQFSSFILSLYTMEISSYYRGIYFLNKYNKDHREHEMTPQSQLKLNIDNDLASKNAKLKIRLDKLYTNYDDIKESAYNRYYNETNLLQRGLLKQK